VTETAVAGPRRLSSVRAPAGWGTSSLAAAWAAEDPRPFAWVALDGLDSDPDRFLAYATAALSSLGTAIEEVLP
jgi:LuxR family maltose regulon positive regulatory protein